MISFILKIIFGLVLIVIFVGAVRTWQEEHGETQKAFEQGLVPDPKPDGFYSGSVANYVFSWRGKKFNAAKSTGINVFDYAHLKNVEAYPFSTSVGMGVRDSALSVFKIDYNLPANPWWLRLVLDEIVEIAPGEYLGKLHVRLIPGYPFTIEYFRLKK